MRRGNAYAGYVDIDWPKSHVRTMFVLEIDHTGLQGPAPKLSDMGTNWTGQPAGIAVRSDGDVVVVGNTDSAQFPLVRATQSTYGGNSDGFVTELDPTLKTQSSAPTWAGR